MSNIDKELEDDEEFSKFMELEEDTNEKSTSDTNDVTADELFKSIDELFKTDEEKSTVSKLNENEKYGSNLTETVRFGQSCEIWGKRNIVGLRGLRAFLEFWSV